MLSPMPAQVPPLLIDFDLKNTCTEHEDLKNDHRQLIEMKSDARKPPLTPYRSLHYFV